MTIHLINASDEKASKAKLENFYTDNFIPAEKKPYITALKNSYGPYLAVESAEAGRSSYIQDAASQIATLGLGFNPAAFFGTAQYLESWTNNSNTKPFQDIRKSFRHFLQRSLGWENVYFRIGHSGAEANELALAECFRQRVNKKARKVLAFEGSFHGRMMVTLSATWNKSKREPFEWPGYETVYCPSPEIADDKMNVEVPKNWAALWEKSSNVNFSPSQKWLSDAQTAIEIKALEKVREHLKQEEIFAIIVEPMQCEGGDRYLSNRFLSALLLMAKTFKVSVIFDEVQTGFHMGHKFFWHRQLELKDQHGNLIAPNYVVCAKKAQVGLLISQSPIDMAGEEFQVASFLRGVIHAQMLSQSSKEIIELENQVRPLLKALIAKYANFIHRPRCNGMAFAFDLKSEEYFNKIIDLRFGHGLLYYNAGTHTLRFRLNLSWDKHDLNFLFVELDKICGELFLASAFVAPKSIDKKMDSVAQLYSWHEFLLGIKLDKLMGKNLNDMEIWQKGLKLIQLPEGTALHLLDPSNFSRFKNPIDNLQKAVYEPARQTSITQFELTAKDNKGIALVVAKGDEIAAMTFASPLKNYPLERGVRRDPYFSDPSCYYVIDTTVSKDFQGSGLGRSLKYALTLAAILKNAKRVNGRNRHILAKAMWNINLSLGSYELDYIREDYPDFGEDRDVVYYTTPVQWERPDLNLTNAIQSPLGVSEISKDFIAKNLPTMINKVCLSNFVGEGFLENFKYLVSLAPKDLHHAYTSSGQSECVDKIAKSIWYTGAKNLKQLTFEGHFFGSGSNLAKSLGQVQEPFFPVTALAHPTEQNYETVLQNVEKELESGKYLAVWIEPLRQRFMDKVPLSFLKGLKKICMKLKVPLVYNETAASSFRYNSEHFFAANNAEISPDALMVYGGGQIGAVLMKKEHYVAKPLMLISTWDGDELSLATYTQSIKNIMSKKMEFDEVKRIFNEVLKNTLAEYPTSQLNFDNGIGNFKGNIPTGMQKLFSKTSGFLEHKVEEVTYLVCPNFDSMQEFIRIAGEGDFGLLEGF